MMNLIHIIDCYSIEYEYNQRSIMNAACDYEAPMQSHSDVISWVQDHIKYLFGLDISAIAVHFISEIPLISDIYLQ